MVSGSTPNGEEVLAADIRESCAEIDDCMKTFLRRPIEGDWPCLWIHVTYLKVRLPSLNNPFIRQRRNSRNQLLTSSITQCYKFGKTRMRHHSFALTAKDAS